MPEKIFEGVLLGGFHIHKKDKEASTNQKVQIKNDYSYVIGLQLTETEKKVTPELKLNTVEPGLNNYRTTLFANLQNTTATMITDMTVTAEVYKENNVEVLRKTVKKINQWLQIQTMTFQFHGIIKHFNQVNID
ncbi:DUF3324 domain-containing protein [Enterococcus faecalis]|nr:DUF3324 domain-containing protein [Enterococcus faecalis]